VLSGSVLCDVLLRYYRDKHLLQAQRQRTDCMKSLITDYNELLAEVKTDPNFAKRIAPATLGTEPNDADTIYPRATIEQLTAARRALTEQPNQQSTEPVVPSWLSRCSEPRRRTILFLAGASLILISFVCFGPAKQETYEDNTNLTK